MKNLITNIILPDNVKVIHNELIYFTGINGTATYKLDNFFDINITDSRLILKIENKNFTKKEFVKFYSILNTVSIILKNYIIGVNKFFERSLVLKGIGYKVDYDKNLNILNLSLGYSHIVKYILPKEVMVEIFNNNEIKLKSISKQLVGQISSEIKSLKLPDSYKGNGIRYKEEKIILKQPKKSK
jgi:large subunit ribosomal protein L6